MAEWKRPDFVKDVRITAPPFAYLEDKGDGKAHAGVGAPMPTWVRDACVGLVLEKLIEGMSGDKRVAVLPDELIEALRAQKPQPRSEEAADWIDRWVYWGGGMNIENEAREIIPTEGPAT